MPLDERWKKWTEGADFPENCLGDAEEVVERDMKEQLKICIPNA